MSSTAAVEVPGPFLSLAAATARTTLSRETLKRAVKAGRLRVFRPTPRRVLVALADLDAFARGEAAVARE